VGLRQLAALKAIDSSYRQRQFIEDGGWVTMPSKTDTSVKPGDILTVAERFF
jgi:hypothetical protein